MTLYRIVHPNGCAARVRAHHARLALRMLADELHDGDWQFGQATPLAEEFGPSVILHVGTPRIPTSPASLPHTPVSC